MNSDEPWLMEQPPGGTIAVLSARDGSRLRYGAWEIPAAERRGVVLLLHGRTEFIEKHYETISDLLARRFSVFTLDWRGQGLSDAQAGEPLKGHVHDFAEYLDDLDLFLEKIVQPQEAEPLIVLGHSMGSHLALRFDHLYPGAFAGMVLCAPLIKIPGQRTTSAVTRGVIRFLGAAGFCTRHAPGRRAYWTAKQKFTGNPLSSDIRRYQLASKWFDQNPDLAVGPPTIGWLSAMFRSIDFIHRAHVGTSIKTPVLMVGAGCDVVVSTDRARDFCDRLPNGEFLLIEKSLHEILHERDALRDTFWDAFDRFVEKVL